MMTDQEMLELAAKAANMRVDLVSQYGVTEWYDSDEHREWNPLTDDGDALRLAVKLKLQIQIIGLYDDEVGCYDLGEVEVFEKHNNDPYAATRRAIVRAAAGVGKDISDGIRALGE